MAADAVKWAYVRHVVTDVVADTVKWAYVSPCGDVCMHHVAHMYLYD